MPWERAHIDNSSSSHQLLCEFLSRLCIRTKPGKTSSHSKGELTWNSQVEGYFCNRPGKLVSMAGLKPLHTVFGIHHRWESFVQLRKNGIAWWSFESSPSFLSIKVCQSFNVRPFYALHFLFQSLLNVVQSIKASTQHDDMSKPNLILTLHSKWWWIFLHCLASLYTLHNQCSSIISLFVLCVLYLYKRTLGTFVCLDSEK